mgnify:CR=1 FL=1
MCSDLSHVLESYSRINQPQGQICQQVGTQDHHRYDQKYALNHRVITCYHRFEYQATYAGIIEQGFDEQRAGQREAGVGRDVVYERQNRVAQRVTVFDPPGGETLGTRDKNCNPADGVRRDAPLLSPAGTTRSQETTGCKAVDRCLGGWSVTI